MNKIIMVKPKKVDSRTVPVINNVWVDPMPPKRRHAAEPIKDQDDIIRVREYLVANHRYRDNLLFIAGINLGFRCGDLLQLKWGHLFDADGNPRETFTFLEDKTNKHRTVKPSEAVWQAVDLYASELTKMYGGIDLDSYVFRSLSNRNVENKPIRVQSVERLLKEIINDELGIDVHASTHLLRKTFGYHMVMNYPDRSRALEMLCYMLNHDSTADTLKYIGITDDEVMGVYENLNLGVINPTISFETKDIAV